MTLYRQLILAVAVLFVVLFGVTVMVGVFSARVLVEQQMQVHAQDTATSVALSMTQAAQEQDIATLDTMFNAVSDSGYFRQMTYHSLNGEKLIDRIFDVRIEGVPDWFVDCVPLPSPQGRAEVAAGWMRLGELTVTSHPGQAYRKLWQVTKNQLTWFAALTVMLCLLAALALRILLKPLGRVERQADAICNQRFVVQQSIPKTRELRSVVDAMNRMAHRLKSIFDSQLSLISQLQEQSLRDTVTGLSNRLDFDTRLRSFVRPDAGPVSGALMIVAIQDFERVNDRAGRSEGNAVLRHLGDKLVAAVSKYPQSIVARRQGPEITLFVPNVIEQEARALAQQLFDCAVTVEWRDQDRDPLALCMGFSYAERVLDLVDMLREADAALHKALASGGSGWQSADQLPSDAEAPMLSTAATEWRDMLEQTIAESKLSLLFQPIYSRKRTLVGHEIFSRLPRNDHLITAGIFMPLAERFGFAHQFDRLAISTLAAAASEIPAGQRLCVNMSLSSVQNEIFVNWLDQYLGSHKSFAKRVVIELPEHAMHVEERYVRQLSELLAGHNTRLGIDHFGLESSAFGYLGSLPLHHIKIHRSFVQGIEQNMDNQFYIQSLAQVARSRDIHLAAEGIEREEEWRALVELGIDAGQGYLLGQPQPELASQ